MSVRFVPFLISIVFVAVLAQGDFATADSTRAAEGSLVGTWVGVVYQHNAAPYPAIMQFSSESEGASDYASYPCGGTLSRVAGKTGYVFEEKITYSDKSPEDGGCIDGRIKLDLYGDALDWTWVGAAPNQDVVAIGTFYRSRKSLTLENDAQEQ